VNRDSAHVFASANDNSFNQNDDFCLACEPEQVSKCNKPSKWSLPSRVLYQNFVSISNVSHACYMPLLSRQS
jgi:hypothetical protein